MCCILLISDCMFYIHLVIDLCTCLLHVKFSKLKYFCSICVGISYTVMVCLENHVILRCVILIFKPVFLFQCCVVN